MNPNWQNFLKAAGAVFDTATPDTLHFGNAAGELQAAQTATVLVSLSHLGLIQCSGDDAKAFLHNQLTSDINHLGDESAQHSAWCTAKGRMMASFLVWRDSDTYRLALATELVGPVVKRLQMFVLRSKVKIEDLSNNHVLLGISGPQVGDALAAANLPMPTVPLTSVAAAGNMVVRLDKNRVLIATTADAAEELWRQLASIARPVGTTPWHWLDIRAGLPLITGATREEFVPQMADFEKIGGVSFHKGCYPGQEVVARTQYLGKVKRHLYRLESNIPLSAGDDLYSPDNPDQSAGKVVLAASSPAGGFEALAVVQSNFAQDLHLVSRDGPKVEATAVNP